MLKGKARWDGMPSQDERERERTQRLQRSHGRGRGEGVRSSSNDRWEEARHTWSSNSWRGKERGTTDRERSNERPKQKMSFMEEAFCMSATPLSRGDFQYLQDDFRPKKRSPSKYEPKNREKDVQDSYHKKRKGGHNRQHRDHSPPHRGASGGESRKVAKRQGNFDISTL